MQASAVFDTAKIIGGRLLRGDLTGIKRLARVNSLFAPNKIVWNFSHLDQLFHALPFDMPGSAPSPLPEAKGPIESTIDLDHYFAERNVKSFLVLKDGAIRHE